MNRFCMLSCVLMVFSVAVLFAQEDKTLPKEAKRLGIKKPTESMKFETIKSKDHKGRQYVIGIDTVEAKKTGLSDKLIKKSLEEAVETVTDKKENNQIVIEIEDCPQDDSKKGKRKLVGTIRRKNDPKDHYEAGEEAVKKFDLPDGRKLIITAKGACKSQNQRLLEKFKFDSIV